MDKKIIGLAEENKVSDLTELLKTVNNEEICQLIERKVLKGRNDTFTLVRAVLLGSPAESSECVERRAQVYRFCINTLQKNDMNNKMASELVGLLMMEADSLPGPTLAELAGLYVEGIKAGSTQSGKALELFPKLLSTIATLDNVVYAGNHMKGVDYKSHVLNSLCSCKWDASNATHLTAMFRDVLLSDDELKHVLEKVVRIFPDVEMSDIPALVYQLLLLSTKGHRKIVLDGVISFFTQQDAVQKSSDVSECSEDLLDDGSDSVELLRHTEGTVILHVSFAVKQHQELGREFVKCLKRNQQCGASRTLSPFNLALSLSLARIHRFEEQIFDFLKGMVLKSFRDAEKWDLSHWVQEVVDEAVSVEEYFTQTIKNSTYGWDHVVQGLVQLGFMLMDSFGPRAPFGRVDAQPSLPSGPNHSACQLGAKVLLNTFKAHEMVRAEIVEQIFNRIATKATSPVTHYLDLLGSVVAASPLMLLDCSGKVREMFEYLSFLSPASAQGLIKAIQPLLKHSMALKDSLILVLRKAMFSRQLDSRKIGASGFLMILKHFQVLGGLSSSQASSQCSSFSSSQMQGDVDVHVSYNPSSNEALCFEILGNLRRCLSQQADVRLLVYQGLPGVLDKNSQLREPILEVLMTQLRGYYEKSTDVNPPLKLEPCIVTQGEQVYLTEPLAHLLYGIQQCLVKAKEIHAKQGTMDDDAADDDDTGVEAELEQMMSSLTQRMITSEMEDFELDKSASYSLATSVGVRNNIFSILVLGTYEVLIEYTFLTQNTSQDSVRTILQLFENYKKLSDVVKEKTGGAGGGKKQKGSATKAPHSLMSLKVISQLLKVLMGDEEDVEDIEALRGNSDFVRYILGVALQRVQEVQEKGQCEGADRPQQVFTYCCCIARLLLCYYVDNQTSDDTQRTREKQILALTLEILVAIVTIVTQRYRGDVPKFLLSLGNKEKAKIEKNSDKVIYKFIQKFQRLVMDVFAADEDSANVKDCVSLLNIVSELSKCLSPGFEHAEHVLTWLEKICKEQTIDDIPLCKSLLTSLLLMTQKLRSSPLLLRDLGQDVHCQIGDVDQDIELEERTNYGIVSRRLAAPTVVQTLLHQCDRELEDTEWTLTRVKAEVSGAQPQDDDQLSQRDGVENSVCKRLGVLVGVFHELVQSALPIGSCTETLLKLVTRMYNLLTMLVKYYLMLFASGHGALSARFEKLVKLSGTHLTQHCYGMITYIQAAETEKVQHAAPEKGKKKADKKKGTSTEAGKSKVLKQTRTIPNLVFSIEQYERFLIQLTKKSKVNLMEHMKHSTSRDFRINVAVLAETLDNDSSSGLESSSDEEAANHEGTASGNESADSHTDENNQENKMPKRKQAPTKNKQPTKKKSILGAKRTVGKPV